MTKKDMKKPNSYSNKSKQGKILEVDVMNKAISMLIREYGFPRERIKTDYLLKISDLDSKKESKSVFQDIVVLDQDNNVEIIVDVHLSHKELYTETNTANLIFNMLGTDAKYGILFNINEKFFFKKILGTQVIEVPNMPAFEKEMVSPDKLKSKVKYEDYFFRTCELLRGSLDVNQFGTILVQILFAKYIDEKDFNNTLLSTKNSNQLQNQIEKLLLEGEKKYKISLVKFLNKEVISDQTLYSIIQETKYFSILKSNPESIIQQLYRIIDNPNLGKKYGGVTIPEYISLLMYKFLVSGATAINIKERKLLLTHIGHGKIVFDTLRHISEEFELIGEDLREFTSSNVSIIDKNKRNIEILKFLLLLKDFATDNIHAQEPMKFSQNTRFSGVMGFPPIGSEIDFSEKILDNDFGKNYIDNYIIQMSENVIPSGYFTLIVTGNYLYSERSKKSRQELLKNNILRGIIQFPPGTFFQTMIPPFMLLLQKKSDKKIKENNYQVFMSDLSRQEFITKHKLSPKLLHNVWENFLELQKIKKILEEDDTSFSVNISELIEIDNWTPTIHNPTNRKMRNIKGRPLSEFIEIISSRPKLRNTDEPLIEIPEIRISDITKEGKINEKIEKTIKAPRSILDSKNALREGDILFSVRGTIGNFGQITSLNKNSIYNQNLIILRPKRNFSEIFYILGTKYFQNQLKNFSTGSTIHYILKKDLETIIIPDRLLNPKNITKIRKIQDEINEIRKKLEVKLQEYEEISKEIEND